MSMLEFEGHKFDSFEELVEFIAKVAKERGWKVWSIEVNLSDKEKEYLKQTGKFVYLGTDGGNEVYLFYSS